MIALFQRFAGCMKWLAFNRIVRWPPQGKENCFQKHDSAEFECFGFARFWAQYADNLPRFIFINHCHGYPTNTYQFILFVRNFISHTEFSALQYGSVTPVYKPLRACSLIWLALISRPTQYCLLMSMQDVAATLLLFQQAPPRSGMQKAAVAGAVVNRHAGLNEIIPDLGKLNTQVRNHGVYRHLVEGFCSDVRIK